MICPWTDCKLEAVLVFLVSMTDLKLFATAPVNYHLSPFSSTERKTEKVLSIV